MFHPEKFEPQFSKSEEVEDPEKDPEQEFLRNEIERVSNITKSFIAIDQERQDRRLNPLFGFDYSKQHIKDLLPVRPPEDRKLTEENLYEAENKALGFILEVADQILQPKPRTINVRENPESLKKIYATLKRGEQLFTDMQEKRPQEVQEFLKKILIERKGIQEEKIKPEQVKQLTDSIRKTQNSIRSQVEPLEDYFRRRL